MVLGVVASSVNDVIGNASYLATAESVNMGIMLGITAPGVGAVLGNSGNLAADLETCDCLDVAGALVNVTPLLGLVGVLNV